MIEIGRSFRQNSGKDESMMADEESDVDDEEDDDDADDAQRRGDQHDESGGAGQGNHRLPQLTSEFSD